MKIHQYKMVSKTKILKEKKDMKRKLTAAALVLAMIMSVSTIAMADEPTEPTEPKQVTATSGSGGAGIAYQEGKVEIINLGNAAIPVTDDGKWSFVTSRDVDFGKHDVLLNVDEQRFASWMEHRTAGTDYLGIIIKNETVAPYQVVVGIDQFFAPNALAPNGKAPTLTGFQLELVTSAFLATERDAEGNLVNITNPYIKEVTNPLKASANSTHLRFNLATDYRGGTVDAGNNGKDPTTAHVFDIPGLGVHAASWGGVLTVPPSSVTEIGEAQAVLTWNIMTVPASAPIVP